MKGVSRRDFLKYCIGSAAALGLDLSVVGRLQKVLAADGAGLPTVLWINGANCTGCTVSLANRIASDAPRDVADLLVNTVSLAFHPNLMGAAGDLAVSTLKQAQEGPYILAVDGGIPTAFDGHTCIVWSEGGLEVTVLEAVRTLAPGALAVLSIGTCASFGGIPGGSPNPTGIQGVSEASGVPAVHIPGCPAHPDWIVWTVAQLLAGSAPELDEDRRPVALFGEHLKIHDHCPRKKADKAKTFGEEGLCLKELGCQGPRTRADCYDRLWNGGVNWCIGANSICLGCTERGFPDRFSPFYDLEELIEGEGDRDRDRVTIMNAIHDRQAQTLTVVATSSSQPGADLRVEGLGTLEWKSWKNFYRQTFTGVDSRPASVRVTSSEGGSATFTFPETDTVSIHSVIYDGSNRTLTVVATSSSQPNVELRAEGFGTLDWKSWKHFYRNTFNEVMAMPASVQVTSSGGGSATRVLPGADTVSVEGVRYDESNGTLTVVATSSNQPNVKLSVEGFGGLDWKSWKSFYRNTFSSISTKPPSIRVTSTGGGSATATVQ